ncbi:MAG: serine hydrolase domain-containing protein [Pseudomonadota bacterium]
MSARYACLYVVFLFGFVWPALAGNEDALDALIDDALSQEIPGVVLLVEGPEVSFFKARGVADRKTKAPVREDNLIRAASVTKTYVAALAVMASQEGVIDLDVSIDAYLSNETLAQLPPAPHPTMRQLLNHTSGAPEYYGTAAYLSWDREEPISTARVLATVTEWPPANAPGEAFSYSNTNYHLVALVLEAVYAKTLSSLLQEHLFEPLGLASTFYNQHRAPGDGIHGYGSLDDEWRDTFEWRDNSGPSSGVKASAADLATWMRALFAKDGVLSQVGAAMAENPIRDDAHWLYGLGAEVYVSQYGDRYYGHTGDIFGYLTAVFYAPAHDTVIVLHMNRWNRDVFEETLERVLREVGRNRR